MKGIFTLVLLAASLFVNAAPPTVASSGLSFYAIDGNYFNLGWTAGNGARRLMIAKIGSEPTFVPQDKTSYTASTEFGLGQQVAPGEYVVYDHFSSSYFLNNLQPSTHYYFRMYEYNGSGNTTEYLTTTYLSGDGWTSTPPTVQTSAASFANITTNSASINWVSGNGQRRLIVAKEGSPVSAEPEANQPYSSASSTFGSGASLGDGNYAVYWSSSNSTTIFNLKAGTEYFLAFYELNGSQYPQYLKPAYNASFTTRSVPTIAPSDLTISKTDGKELTLNWTNGNGQRRLVVARKGSAVTSVPSSGTDYSANAFFGQGAQMAPGEYVVYADNFHSTTVSGLEPGVTYHFKVFEYDGTGTSTAYLTASFAAVDGATATTPAIQAAFLAPTNVAAQTLTLNLTPGDGRARMVVGRKTTSPQVNPSDFTVYDYDGIFGSGQDLGSENFALAVTSGSSVNIQGLQANTGYQFSVYELNGFNQPLYRSPAATVAVTTSTALPVKLVSFEAQALEKEVVVQWKTATETNTSHFEVERSADGVVFAPFATVNASGNSNEEKAYRVVDPQPLQGKAYYRLKMIDQDHHWEYSPVRLVTTTAKDAVRILSNPVQDQLQVFNSVQQPSAWRIVNVAGQVLAKGVLTNGRQTINVSSFLRGQYWLQAEDRYTFISIPFSKQ